MILVMSGKYVKAYPNKKHYIADFSALRESDWLLASNVNVLEFIVSGYNYHAKKQSAYTQCVSLFQILKNWYYDNATLFEIVGWIQRNSGQYGLHKRLRKEGYYD